MAPPKDVPRTKLPALDASSATQSPTSFALAASMMESPMEDLGSPDIDPPFILFPEWTDADIAAEKWATKHAFEDPDSQQFFPRTLRGGLDHYKRPTEWIGESLTPIVVGTQAQLDDVFYGKIPLNGALIGFGATEAGAALNLDPTASQTDVSGPDQSNPEEVHSGSLASGGSLDPISVTQPPETLQPGSQHQSTQNLEDRSDSLQPPSQSLLQSTQLDESFNSTAQERESVDGLSKLFHVNRHLLKSELMTQILTCFHFFFDQSKTMKSVGTGDEFCLWDSIYPKNKDGSPMYNASGKYAVKLFWLGAWRKVIVDDRIPCSVDGKPLVITSPTIQELWPLIISKAILKLATYSYKDLSEFPEQGDFDTFYALRGWIPERLPVNGNENSALWNVLKGLNCKIYNFNAAKANAPASRASLLATNPALSMRASSFTPTDPYVVIFGFREALEPTGEEVDIKALGFPFRILEMRDGEDLTINESEPSEPSKPQKLVRIRGYFSCGIRKKSATANAPSRKGASGSSDIPMPEAMDTWIEFEEFLSSFRYITVHHNPGSFKNVKSIQCISDPNRPSDTYRVFPLLCPEDRDCSVLVAISAHGRVKTEFNSQMTTISIEKYEWKRATSQIPTLKVSTNAVAVVMLRMPAKCQAFRFSVDSTASYSLTFLSKYDFNLEDESKIISERYGLTVRDFEDTYAAQSQANAWSVVYKQIMHFQEPTFMLASFFTPDPVASHSELSIVDNDTLELVPQVFFQTRGRNYLPNKNGYTLLAHLRTPQSRPAGKFKVRLITEPNWTPAVDRPLETWTKPIVQDFEEALTPNKHNILFRSLLKVKDAPVNPASMQVTFSISELWIKLQLFDNDVEVFSGRGKGVVTIPVYFFHLTEEPKPEKAKEEKGAKEKPASQGAARSILQKHKYILQAIVERPELSKSITTGSVADSTRPSSRGIKTANEKGSVAGSAKKKKAATPSGLEEKTPTFNEPSWHLRIVSTDSASMIVQRDTEKEDRYKAAKDAWESSQPGRSARAQDIRSLYMKAVESSVVQPVVIPDALGQSGCKPWTIIKPSVVVHDVVTKPTISKSPSSLNVIAEHGWATIQEQRRQKLQEELSIFEDLRAARKSEKDKRLSQNILRDILDRQAQEIEELSKADNTRRLDYRARLIRELEAEAKAIEAAKSAEIAALAQVDEAAALEKKKKAGKK